MFIKRKQWLWVFFSVLLIALAYFGYVLTPKADILMKNDYNNIGNMYILANAVQDGEYYYYISFSSSSLCKAIKDDYNLEKSEDFGGNIEKLFLPSNGVLYYVDGDDNDSIYSIDKDGKNKTKLTDMTCNELITFQDKIYFTSADGLYSMDYDGSNLEMVYSEPVTNIFPYESFLYFIQTYEDVQVKDVVMDQERIMRFCPNDNEIKEIGGKYVQRFFVLNDRIYFLDKVTLYNMDIDGQDILKIPGFNAHIDTMNFYGKYFIFSSADQTIGTFAINSQTAEVKKISSRLYRYIFVINDALLTDDELIQLKDSKFG